VSDNVLHAALDPNYRKLRMNLRKLVTLRVHVQHDESQKYRTYDRETSKLPFCKLMMLNFSCAQNNWVSPRRIIMKIKILINLSKASVSVVSRSPRYYLNITPYHFNVSEDTEIITVRCAPPTVSYSCVLGSLSLPTCGKANIFSATSISGGSNAPRWAHLSFNFPFATDETFFARSSDDTPSTKQCEQC